jgi:hypothetical protein
MLSASLAAPVGRASPLTGGGWHGQQNQRHAPAAQDKPGAAWQPP